jgi:uncharacterized phage protein (TIGR01671 family)
MNDRFKFRVYYKPHNKVYNVICLNCDRQNEIVIEYKGSTAIVEWENCEIIQCTGLKDKNGKLIFEGDIVTGKDHFDRDRKCIVEYSKTYCCYFITGDGWSDEYMFNLNDKEVIGNIYENEDLRQKECK